MASLAWCSKQERGISLIEPNDNLANEYFANAEETLTILKAITGKSNMWLATTKYYCEYFAVYALLMKLGVKSEIHDCTIALCDFLEKQGFLPKGSFKLLSEDKQLRIDNQYYLKNKQVYVNYDLLVQFVLTIKTTHLAHFLREAQRREQRLSLIGRPDATGQLHIEAIGNPVTKETFALAVYQPLEHAAIQPSRPPQPVKQP